MVKAWYLSKMMWLNGIAFFAILAQLVAGFVMTPGEQVAILAVANLILRAYTNEAIE